MQDHMCTHMHYIRFLTNITLHVHDLMIDLQFTLKIFRLAPGSRHPFLIRFISCVSLAKNPIRTWCTVPKVIKRDSSGSSHNLKASYNLVSRLIRSNLGTDCGLRHSPLPPTTNCPYRIFAATTRAPLSFGESPPWGFVFFLFWSWKKF